MANISEESQDTSFPSNDPVPPQPDVETAGGNPEAEAVTAPVPLDVLCDEIAADLLASDRDDRAAEVLKQASGNKRIAAAKKWKEVIDRHDDREDRVRYPNREALRLAHFPERSERYMRMLLAVGRADDPRAELDKQNAKAAAGMRKTRAGRNPAPPAPPAPQPAPPTGSAQPAPAPATAAPATAPATAEPRDQPETAEQYKGPEQQADVVPPVSTVQSDNIQSENVQPEDANSDDAEPQDTKAGEPAETVTAETAAKMRLDPAWVVGSGVYGVINPMVEFLQNYPEDIQSFSFDEHELILANIAAVLGKTVTVAEEDQQLAA